MHREAARRTLVADGDKDRAVRLRSMLATGGRHVDLTGSLADALTLLERREHDSLVLSLELPDGGGVAAVHAACQLRPGLAVVVVAERYDDVLARAVLAVGAQDYVADGSADRLPEALEHAVARAGIVGRLHESNLRRGSVIGALPGCTAVAFDDRLGVTSVEGQLSQLVGHRLEYPGQHADDVFGAERMKRFRPHWERALAGERFSVEWAADGDGRCYASHYAPVHDAHGHQLGGVAVVIDIHERLLAESNLAASRRRHSEFAEAMPVGIAEFDVDGICRYVNGRYCEMIGVSPDEAIGQYWGDASHPEDVQRTVDEWRAAQAEGREFQMDHRVGRPGHGYMWVSRRLRVIPDERGETRGYMTTFSDIEERRRSDQALREATVLFTAAFEHAPVGMGIVAVDGLYQQVNQALCALLGRSPEEIVGRHAGEFMDPEHHDDPVRALDALVSGGSEEWEAEGCLARPDGSSVWTLQRTTALRTSDGEPTLLFTQMVDIGKRRSQEEELRHLADHDVLTGLANRRLFESELTRHIVESERFGDSGAVLLLDLDRFKRINDEQGHLAGDRALVHVADVLRRRLRRTDVVGRIGGDEFAVLLREGGEAQAVVVAEMLTAAIAETGTKVSIGVTPLQADDGSAQTVLVRADRAMYEVKRRQSA